MATGDDVFQHDLKAVQLMLDRFPLKAANHARNFFDKSWTNKGFTDKMWQPWRPVRDRNGKIKERPLVVTGRLRRSLRVEPGHVYTEVEYAAIHNEGGTQNHTETVRAHTRRGHNVRSHTRNVNRLTPKRQFMGPSEKLDQEIEDMIVEDLDKIFFK
jgi:phage gpG-like protein